MFEKRGLNLFQPCWNKSSIREHKEVLVRDVRPRLAIVFAPGATESHKLVTVSEIENHYNRETNGRQHERCQFPVSAPFFGIHEATMGAHVLSSLDVVPLGTAPES